MKSASEIVASVRSFMDEVTAETKKATWPTREELIQSTALVLVTVVILSVVVGVSDRILSVVLKHLVFRS